MTYIDLINRFWKLNREYSFSPSESLLYLKLLDTCNSGSWKNPFNQSNRYICVETGISERTLIDARNRLKQLGLINFISGKKRREVTQYMIEGLPHYPTNCSTTFSARFSEPFSDDCTQPRKNASDNKEEEKKKSEKKKEDKSSLSTKVDPAALRADIQSIIDDYNEICSRLPKTKLITDKRMKMVGARLREHGMEAVLKMLQMAAASDFLAGDNRRGWMADFDWLFRPTNFVKVHEGNYSKTFKPKPKEPEFKPSPLQILQETYENMMNDGTFNS